jgi:Leucine-rich repeat (LRR) protein
MKRILNFVGLIRSPLSWIVALLVLLVVLAAICWFSNSEPDVLIPRSQLSEELENAHDLLLSAVVNFLDSGLEAAVRDETDNPSQPIRLSNLLWLTHLEAEGQGISNLEGIQYCPRAGTLDLDRNQIVDLSLLADLTNLYSLSLSENPIVDLSPLLGLPNLYDLFLDGNQIVDLSLLADLTNLERLSLDGNQIIDLSPLSALTSLRNLSLSENQIVDLSPLSALTNLETLFLDGNQIVDLSPLSALTKLENLFLSENQIVDLSPLSALTNLEILLLSENQIVDLSPLSTLTNLEILSLDGNQIVDITALVNNPGFGVWRSSYPRYSISLLRNYLDLTSGSSDMLNIQFLTDRGIDVQYEAQKQPEID